MNLPNSRPGQISAVAIAVDVPTPSTDSSSGSRPFFDNRLPNIPNNLGPGFFQDIELEPLLG